MKTEFIIAGFHCKSCEMLIKDVCSDFKEIISCRVDVKTGKVIIGHEPELNFSQLKKEIESLGDYRVKK